VHLINPASEVESGIFLFLADFQFEEIKNSEKTILSDFSQYHLNTVDIEKKFSHIGILRKNSHFSGFNMIPDVMYALVLVTHLSLQWCFHC